MKGRVEIARSALKQLEDITDKRVREKLFQRIEQLENDPESQGKPPRNELSGLLSVRAIAERYRIIYKIEYELVIVIVVAVGIRRERGRSDIYRSAPRLSVTGLMTP